MRRGSVALCFGLAWLAVSATSQAETRFLSLGYLPDAGRFESYGLAGSADLRVIVGQATIEDPDRCAPNGICFEARTCIRWTEGTGMAALGEASGGRFRHRCFATSGAGDVIIGVADQTSAPNPPFVQRQGLVWTPATGMVAIDELIGIEGVRIVPNNLSRDGSVVSGTIDPGGDPVSFMWNRETGEVRTIEAPEGVHSTYIIDLSADGSRAVGSMRYDDGEIGPFVWSEEDGLRPIEVMLDGVTPLIPEGISDDGKLLFGSASRGTARFPYVFTEARGVEPLGLPVIAFSFAIGGASRDGLVHVGEVAHPGAMVFRPGQEPRAIVDLLVERGIDMEGWVLDRATAVSADGRSVMGYGRQFFRSEEAWVAYDLLPRTIEIDVRPESSINHVNPVGRDLLPIVLKGGPEFDVTRIEQASLAAGPLDAKRDRWKGVQIEDFDGDGDTDLLAGFWARDLGLENGETQMCVRGELEDGTPFEGCDQILSLAAACVDPNANW